MSGRCDTGDEEGSQPRYVQSDTGWLSVGCHSLLASLSQMTILYMDMDVMGC